jgi:hypothetical protein
MQPGAFETEHTRQGREAVAEAIRNIETRMAALDQTTEFCRMQGQVARAQLAMIPALSHWMFQERELGATDAELFGAGRNVLINLATSLIGSTIMPTGYAPAIQAMLLSLHGGMMETLIQRKHDQYRTVRDYNPNQGRA